MNFTYLIQNLNELKHLYQYPIFYLSEFFAELRTQIDLTFVKKKINLIQLNQYDEIQDSISLNWSQLIDKTNEFESECLKRAASLQSELELCHEIQENIKYIQYNLECFNENQDHCDEINYLIYDSAFKLKRYLFNNQTIYFLDREKCILQRILVGLNYKTTCGKLLIVKNEHFDTINLGLLNDFNKKFKIKRLTNEVIKLKFLKETLERSEYSMSSSQILEIQLDFSKFVNNFYFFNCQIESLADELFKDLNHTNSIWLCQNNIRNISSRCLKYSLRDFSSFANLKLLDLSKNRIEILESDLLSELNQLVYFDASSNQIKFVDYKLFNRSNKLKIIKLENNQLTHLDVSLFVGLDCVEFINLANNKLDHIEGEYFLGLNRDALVNKKSNYIHYFNLNFL